MSDVLVYSGPGVSNSALHHTLKSLRLLLASYDVKTVDAKTLALDPWQKGTSLVVIPGGRDLPYVSELAKTYTHAEAESSSGHQACTNIREFVEQGGNYLGICAGAYYASSYCAFETGTSMQVDGPRPFLQFYPGTCQGTVYSGFVYESDKGARIIDIERIGEKDRWRCHYNGGGAFMGADRFKDQQVEVLATYTDTQPEELLAGLDLGDEQPRRPNYAGEAAVVLASIQKGKAVLFGTHPEFPLLPTSTPVRHAENDPQSHADRATMEAELLHHERRRLRWLAQIFQDRLGLRTELPSWAADVQPQPSSVESEPKLLPIFAASVDNGGPDLRQMFTSVVQHGSADKATHLPGIDACDMLRSATFGSVKDSNDALHFAKADQDAIKQAFQLCQTAEYGSFSRPATELDAAQEAILEVDLDNVPKYIFVCSEDTTVLDPILFPHWNTEAYAKHLSNYRAINAQRVADKEAGHWSTWKPPFDPFNPLGSISGPPQPPRFGSPMLYTQMVTSTQTMLDKNFRLLSALPVGTTFFATQQISGRGRGGNRWISPKGCLQFSSVFRVPLRMASKTVFLQYLSGLAVVEGIRLALGDTAAGRLVGSKVRIKWPNDVYAEIPAEQKDGQQARAKTATFELDGKRYAKLGGILVNSQFSGGQDFVLVSGCGVNCLNARPSTSVSDLIETHNKTAQDGDVLESVSQEKLAGAILSNFDSIWETFMRHEGNFAPFVDRYRQIWLHNDQETTLTADALRATRSEQGEEKVRIIGISSDHGLLQAVPLTSTIRANDAKAWGDTRNSEVNNITQLQPDGNSFDMLQNLVKRKA